MKVDFATYLISSWLGFLYGLLSFSSWAKMKIEAIKFDLDFILSLDYEEAKRRIFDAAFRVGLIVGSVSFSVFFLFLP